MKKLCISTALLVLSFCVNQPFVCAQDSYLNKKYEKCIMGKGFKQKKLFPANNNNQLRKQKAFDEQQMIKLINKLKSPYKNKWMRNTDIRRLAEYGKKNPKLVCDKVCDTLLKSPKRSSKVTGLAILKTMGTKAMPALSAIEKAISEGVPNTAISTAITVSKDNPAEILRILNKALKSNNSAIQQAALRGFGNLEVKGTNAKNIGTVTVAASQLAKYLGHPDAYSQSLAARSLGKLGRQYPKTVLTELTKAYKTKGPNVKNGVIITLCKMNKHITIKALPLILKSMSSKNKNVQSAVKYELIDLVNSPQTSYVVLPKIQDLLISGQDAQTRKIAAEVLSRVKSSIAIKCLDGLLTAMEDQNSMVRFFSATAVANIGTDRLQVFEKLKNLYTSSRNPLFRDSAAQAFKQLGSKAKTALPMLIKQLSNTKEPLTHNETAKAIAHILKSFKKNNRRQYYSTMFDVTFTLQELTQNNDPIILTAALNALGHIGYDLPGQVIYSVLDKLHDKNNNVKRAAMFAVTKISNDKRGRVIVLPHLKQLFESGNIDMKVSACEIFRFMSWKNPKDDKFAYDLEKHITKQNFKLNYAICMAIGRILKNQDAVKLLQKYITNPSSNIQYAAVHAIINIKMFENIPSIISLILPDKDQSANLSKVYTQLCSENKGLFPKDIIKRIRLKHKLLSSSIELCRKNNEEFTAGNAVKYMRQLMRYMIERAKSLKNQRDS